MRRFLGALINEKSAGWRLISQIIFSANPHKEKQRITPEADVP
ncbi:MAG TPA: hypothetical protein VGD14_04830 [bacterium]